MSLLMLCLKIFFARILDVSLGVMRTVVTVKGKPLNASVIAFFEVFLWFVIAREALNTAGFSLWIAVAYAGGYATGTFIGTKLSTLLIKGVVGVQVVTGNPSDEMIRTIREHGVAVSIINLYSTDGTNDKKMLYIQITNFKLKELVSLVKELDPKAFIVVNDTKYVQNGFIK